ncbi:MAG: hypothetical protein WBA36_00070 [Mesorhizobium sp.]
MQASNMGFFPLAGLSYRAADHEALTILVHGSDNVHFSKSVPGVLDEKRNRVVRNAPDACCRDDGGIGR